MTGSAGRQPRCSRSKYHHLMLRCPDCGEPSQVGDNDLDQYVWDVWDDGRREITRIEQTAAVWAAEQIIAEATVRGDLDERTVKALGHFLLRLSEGSDCYVLD